MLGHSVPEKLMALGPRFGLAPQAHELGKDVLYRVGVGRVPLKEEWLGVGRTDESANDFAHMAAEIVYDDDIVSATRGDVNSARLAELHRISISFESMGAISVHVNDSRQRQRSRL
jgi:hypothetical protein